MLLGVKYPTKYSEITNDTIFPYDYHGAPFVLFGTWHIVALLVISLINIAILGFRKAAEKNHRVIRWSMVVIICLCEGSLELWNAHWHPWTIQTMLSLPLCNMLMLLACFMLIFKNYHIDEFVYFLGFGAASSALITPNAGIYAFPTSGLSSHSLLMDYCSHLQSI